jgi:Tol biopolymer transport system component
MRRILVPALVAVAITAAAASAMSFGSWTAAVNVEAAGADASVNTAALEGCPSISRDGLKLFFASNRLGGNGGLDIYVSTRDSADEPWGAPVNVGPPVNTSADEFCPTPQRDGHGFLFVSTKAGGCGGADMYSTREGLRGWAAPQNLGCTVNSAADEASPFLVGDEFYFSSTRSGTSKIYVAPVAEDGSIGTPVPAPGLTSSAQDARPNVRRDGLEIFFDSTRGGGCGGADIWTSTRATAGDPWSAPTDLGCAVNSSATDVRASLSWDGTHLYFGSTRGGGEGSQDLYVTTREKLPASANE